jgi:hypothetical protein
MWALHYFHLSDGPSSDADARPMSLLQDLCIHVAPFTRFRLIIKVAASVIRRRVPRP